MAQTIHKVPRTDTARPRELTRREALIRSAPTEPEAFLQWGTQREREEGKLELSHGQVTWDMISAPRPHGRVVQNLIIELGRLLDLDRYDMNAADFAVRTPFGVRSPDVVVDDAAQQRDLSTSAPVFIAEVLSFSTQGKDFTVKLEEYSAIPAQQTYLICSQDEPRAWVWAREADGIWPRRPVGVAGRDGAIALGGLGVELAMAAIFRGIPDAPASE